MPLDDKDTSSDIHEYETRRVINAFIRRQYIALPRWCWWTYDWLEKRGYDMQTWVRYLDIERNSQSLSKEIESNLYYELCRMMQEGREYPPFLGPPEDWEAFEDIPPRH